MVARMRIATERIINNLFNNGEGLSGSFAALRATKVIDDCYAQRLWPLIMPYLSSELVITNDSLNYEIQAIYQSLRLYAIHQQGRRNRQGELLAVYASEEEGGLELLEALALLRQDKDIRDGIDRQVVRALAAPNLQSLMNSLIRLVKILKANDEVNKINYVQLTQDIYSFQWGGDSLRHLRFKWGTQYYYNELGKESD